MLHHYCPFQDGISALHNDVDAMQQRLQRLTWEMGHSMGCSKCRWCCRFWAMDGHGMFTLPPIIMIIMEVKNASQRSAVFQWIPEMTGDGCSMLELDIVDLSSFSRGEAAEPKLNSNCSTIPVSMLVVLVDVSMLDIQGPQCTCQ